MMHKFVDDTTLSEFIAKSGRSVMNACCDELVQQLNEIKMNVNGRKRKEMLLGPIAIDPPPPIPPCGTTVNRVQVFRLIGVHVSSDLKWTEHVDAITSKAASRLYFLKQLRRARMSQPRTCCTSTLL